MDQLITPYNDDDDLIVVPDSPWELSFESEDEPTAQADDGAEDDRPSAPMEIDFDDPVSEHLFKTLKHAARDACNVNSDEQSRRRALRWMFVPGAENGDGVDFEHACIALQSRPNVVRVRAILQMYRAGVVLEDPLPIEATPLPQELESEVMARVGFGLPVDLAHAIWSWPSISALDLMQKFEGQDMGRALRALDAEGLIAASKMRLYFVARNPDIMPVHLLRRFSFARSLHISY